MSIKYVHSISENTSNTSINGSSNVYTFPVQAQPHTQPTINTITTTIWPFPTEEAAEKAATQARLERLSERLDAMEDDLNHCLIELRYYKKKCELLQRM